MHICVFSFSSYCWRQKAKFDLGFRQWSDFCPRLAGVTMKLEGVALRAVVGGWVVVACLLVWSYSGLLVSVMTVRRVPRPIQTARDLLDRSHARVIMRANTAYTDLMAVSLAPCAYLSDEIM